MGTHPRLWGPSLVLLACVILAGASWVAAQAPDTRQLRTPLVAPEDIVAHQVTATDLTVLLGQRVQTILGVHRPDPESGILEGEHAWQVVVYFDAPLSTPDGLRQAAKLLSREAESLTRLGLTEIVLADPSPRRYLEGTRDPFAVRDALQDVRTEALTTGELVWHRQRFSVAQLDGEDSQISRALRDEEALIEQQRLSLVRWLTGSTSGEPRLLVLVQNGYDLNPRVFYAVQTAGSFLEDPRSGLSQSVLSQALSLAGWTVICLALGPKPEEFFDSATPLFELAHATGGEVITHRREGSRLLHKVATWPILEVQLAADPDAGAQSFEVFLSGSEQRLQTRRWAAAAPLPVLAEIRSSADLAAEEPRPVLQLLRLEGLALEGEVRFRTITGRHRVHNVVFLLDDIVVAETQRAPYSALINLGPTVQPHTVSAIAYSRSNRKVGEDTLRLNMDLEPPKVMISALTYDPEEGVLEIAATASAPASLRPDRIEIYLNDHQERTLTEPPYRARIAIKELRPEDVVRVVGHYPTGDTAEAAKLPAAAGPSDELDVNLVELLAMVTPRNRRTIVDLESTDFVIRQQGRSLPVDQFSHWEEMPLTLGLVLDTSDSMDVILEDAREAGERFFQEALRADDEAFVVDFNNQPRLASRVTADSNELLHSLVGLEAKGMTALYDAIVFSLQQFENTSGRRALVVVTDGEDSASHYQPRECVRQAKLHGVPVYLIVLGSPPDPHSEPEQLRNLMLARRTGGEVYYLSDLADLSQIYDQILRELRRQFFLAFDAGHTLTPEELEEIEIEVVQKGISVRTLLASQQRGG